MRKINTDYDLLLFLYVYLRQMDLSIDRVRWASWQELQDFYHSNISPMVMMNFLEKKYNVSVIDVANISPIRPPLSSDSELITISEVNYTLYLLNLFNKLLCSNPINFKQEHENLRYTVAVFYSNNFESKLSSDDLERAMKVDHFFRTEGLHTHALFEFGEID